MNPEFIIIRTDKTGECWNWKNNIKKNGYGTLTVHAHRLSFLIFKGPIPKGMVLNHKCKNRKCVNPDHLEVVTIKENTIEKDSNSKSAINSRKTHCPRGHPYNLKTKRGERRCTKCDNIKRNLRNQAKREAKS